MKPFLQLVAESLRSQFGNDLSRVIVIFPNKRANLFLNNYLLGEDGPIWAPRYMTINELFASFSPCQIADPIDTVCRLYQLYKSIAHTTDTLDAFYGWGERILADFDDVDKNRGDADSIFRDLRDYESIGADDEILTEEQVAQLQRFIADFSMQKRSVVRERFIALWNALLPLYHTLRKELRSEGLAYEGQLFRDVIEALESGKAHLPQEVEKVAFVGFNVLDEVEKGLFTYVQQQGKALFYWDYDVHYTTQRTNLPINEAGVFLQENLLRFPNALTGKDLFNHWEKRAEPMRIEYVEADTNAIQAQYVTQWLQPDTGHFNALAASHTAVVLCDEKQLQPVLHALPADEQYKVNVTKGFPFNHTPAYTCVMKAIANITAQFSENGNAANEAPSAQHAMDVLSGIQEQLKAEAIEAQENELPGSWNETLYTEAYFKAFTTLSHFIQLIENGRLNEPGTQLLSMGYPTLFRLIKQVMRTLSVPFHGEPAIGLQVMGVLETRCLDFDHVLMLSVGEGILPQRASEASFIPFLIRKRYGLTTALRKTAVYAYYFYRLLQRASTVTLVYNGHTEGISRGEMSRFMRNLLIDPLFAPHIIRQHLLSLPKPSVKPKEADELKPLRNNMPLFKRMAPSALNCYLNCPRQFYYKYVKHITAPKNAEGIIDLRDFGTLMHKAAELFYTELSAEHAAITPRLLQNVLADKGQPYLDSLLKRTFAEVNAELAESSQPTVEETTIIKASLMRYLNLLLQYEAGKKGEAPATSFQFEAAECKLSTMLKVPFGDEEEPVDFELYGTIDRLDCATLAEGTQCVRVIDYKTGGSPVTVKDMDALFDREKISNSNNDPKYAFQTFVYCLLVIDSKPQLVNGRAITPAIYYIPRMVSKEFTPYITYDNALLTNFKNIAPTFRERLTALIAEIIHPNNTFPRHENKHHCKWCDYKELCGVTVKDFDFN